MTENLSVSVGQTFATVPMWKIRHTTVIGWGQGGWVGRVGVRGVEVGGLGRGFGVGEGWGQGVEVRGVGVRELGCGGWGRVVCLTCCVANLLCGKSSVANLPYGESSGNQYIG